MDEIMKLARSKAKELYDAGVRVTIDDLIELTKETMQIQIEGLKESPLKEYFRKSIEISERELKDLMEIKELQNESKRIN